MNRFFQSVRNFFIRQAGQWVLALIAVSVVTPLQAEMQKPRIAVRPPAVSDSIGATARQRLDVDLLVTEIRSAIQNTRKFDVQNRDKEVLKAVRNEQLMSDEEVVIQGANFVVTATVQDFVYYRNVKPIPNLDDKYSRVDSGRLVVSAQITDVAANAIKQTFSLSEKFATAKKITNEKGGAPLPIHFAEMAKGIAAQMADQLVDTVFPMLVINTKDDRVWINRGNDGGLKHGELLHVYRVGESLVDPYTGETLGSEEEFIGKLKIDRINPKFTIAKTTGDIAVAKGDIVRKP